MTTHRIWVFIFVCAEWIISENCRNLCVTKWFSFLVCAENWKSTVDSFIFLGFFFSHMRGTANVRYVTCIRAMSNYLHRFFACDYFGKVISDKALMSWPFDKISFVTHFLLANKISQWKEKLVESSRNSPNSHCLCMRKKSQ